MAPLGGGMAPLGGGMAPLGGGMAPLGGGMAPLGGGMATEDTVHQREAEAAALPDGGVVWRGTGPDRFTSANLPEHLRILQRAPGEAKRLWEPKVREGLDQRRGRVINEIKGSRSKGFRRTGFPCR
jgi:hypothetical protein